MNNGDNIKFYIWLLTFKLWLCLQWMLFGVILEKLTKNQIGNFGRFIRTFGYFVAESLQNARVACDGLTRDFEISRPIFRPLKLGSDLQAY